MMGFDRTPAERAADAASTELQDFLLTLSETPKPSQLARLKDLQDRQDRAWRVVHEMRSRRR